MKPYIVRKNEIGTYLEALINEYNSRIGDGVTTYETLKSFRKSIAERRRILKNSK
jgi:hypothetical protein